MHKKEIKYKVTEKCKWDLWVDMSSKRKIPIVPWHNFRDFSYFNWSKFEAKAILAYKTGNLNFLANFKNDALNRFGDYMCPNKTVDCVTRR